MLWSGEKKGSASSFGELAPKKPLMLKGSVGDDLEHLEKDRAIRTEPGDTRNRRTIKLLKKNESWGFALQTYGVRNKRSNEIEVMTYVDYVDYNGPAWLAGLQKGDIFLSINGEPVEGATHKQLVEKIRKVGNSMRLVVLFEDCCRKVELYEKFIKLKQVLSAKLTQLQDLKMKENAVLKKCGLNRLEEIRGSVRSTQSSFSNDWDRFSVLGNSMSLRSIPNHIRDKRRSYAVNCDSASDLSINNSFNDSLSDSESSAFLSSSTINMALNNPQVRIENVDSASEYSLPLHSNFQLGGKFLTFSEGDSGSISSFEHIESCDKSCDKSCDQTDDKSCDQTDDKSLDAIENSKHRPRNTEKSQSNKLSEELSDTSSTQSHDKSHDESCDEQDAKSCDTLEDESCDTLEDESCDTLEDKSCHKLGAKSHDALEDKSCDELEDKSHDKLEDKSCDTLEDKLGDKSHDELEDKSCDTKEDKSCDEVASIANDKAQNKSHDESCDITEQPKTKAGIKRFKDGILINEEDASTKL